MIKQFMNTEQSLSWGVLLHGISVFVLCFLFNFLPLTGLIPCVYPLSQSLILALALVLFIHLLDIDRFLVRKSRLIILIESLLMLLTFWFGSYTYSPLGFSTGRISVLQGFEVTRFSRQPISIASKENITITSNFATGIRAVTLPLDLTCTWMSSRGGSIEDPRSCETAYLPPVGVDYDILKLLIQPSCHLPNALGEIRFIILP
jgi:hypothetical protein